MATGGAAGTPASYSVKIEGLEELAKKFGQVPSFQTMLHRADVAAAGEIQGAVMAEVPVIHGFLKGHWRIVQKPTVAVVTSVAYARRVWKGFAPGIPPQDGLDALGRQFHQAPNDYVERAIAKVKGKITSEYLAAVRSWLSVKWF